MRRICGWTKGGQALLQEARLSYRDVITNSETGRSSVVRGHAQAHEIKATDAGVGGGDDPTISELRTQLRPTGGAPGGRLTRRESTTVAPP